VTRRRGGEDEQFATSGSRTVVKGNYVRIPTEASARERVSGRGGSRTRTVVKANFRRSFTGNRQRLQRSADYYSQRPDGDGERQKRSAFDREHEGLSKADVDEFIAKGEGEFGYRMVMSPGRDLDESELQDWTRGVMQHLESQHEAQWVAYAHVDQTEHPHVHVISFVDEKLDRDDFYELRALGDFEASQVMTYWHRLERSLSNEKDEDDPESGAGARGSGAKGSGGGGSDAVANILRAGLEAQADEENELKKRFEHELG
jgi:hypothetical protein